MESRRGPLLGLLVLGFLLVDPVTLGAQGPEEQQPGPSHRAVPADSLLRIIRRLEARVDSLEEILAEGPAVPTAGGPRRRGRERAGQERARVEDELAALRAAARERVADAPPADTTTAPAGLKSLNLNDFNPEISVNGDVRFVGFSPGPQRDNVDLREFAVQVQAPLDPFSHAVFAFAVGDGGFTFEEGYGYWTGLPGGMRLDLGRFRQRIGELNRWHLHALPEGDYPLVLRDLFGDDGLVGNGASLYGTLPVQSPGGGVHELWLQLTKANDEVLFEGGNRLAYMGRVNNFWQVTDATYFQVGASALWGDNPAAELEAAVLGGDFRISWVPPGRSLHSSFTVRGEGYWTERTIGDAGHDRFGGYLSTTLQLSQRWSLGGRVDWVEPLDLPDDHVWAVVPQLTYWQSEWVFVRGELGVQSVPDPDGSRDLESRFGIQIVWSLGPHKHANY